MKAIWIAIGAYTVAWGAWIGSPFWDAFTPRAGLYDAMADFMPEWAWGLHAILIGTAILYGVMAHWPRGIVWGMIAGTYHWALIAFLYAWGDLNNTGMITSLFLVALIQIAWRYGRPEPVCVHPLD
jgi:hypothetical protein